MENIAFGPVPSRRLGKSIGINNIPPKICSYACIYCQLGRAIYMDDQRKTHYQPDEIISSVKNKLSQARQNNEPVDYLTFVPDGEPTLDENLCQEIRRLKDTESKLAVITNSSLLHDQKVRKALQQTDLVSVKIDAVDEPIWKKINRPHKNIKLAAVLDGLKTFSKEFQGKLITETMLINGINDTKECLEDTAQFISLLHPHATYISIPTRPPAKKSVKPAKEEKVNMAYQIFSEYTSHVEYLIGYEGNAFAHSGNTEKDILGITAVHPMREDAVQEFLEKDGADSSLIDKLVKNGRLLETKFNGKKFYVRKFSEKQQM